MIVALFQERLKNLRQKKNMRQKDVAKKLGITESAYGFYEQGRREPSHETLQQLADIFDVQVDWLLGRTDDPTPPKKSKPYYALTEKDERDIARDLERMMRDLESDEAMAFYGEPMDEETRELIRLSLEHSMRIGKELAKKKFTPKKHRNE
jgi:transcriptional regulator with XRE-family HTH domain